MVLSAPQQVDPKLAREIEELHVAIFQVFQSRDTLPEMAIASLFNEVCYVAELSIRANKDNPNYKAQLLSNIEQAAYGALQYLKNNT